MCRRHSPAPDRRFCSEHRTHTTADQSTTYGHINISICMALWRYTPFRSPKITISTHLPHQKQRAGRQFDAPRASTSQSPRYCTPTQLTRSCMRLDDLRIDEYSNIFGLIFASPRPTPPTFSPSHLFRSCPFPAVSYWPPAYSLVSAHTPSQYSPPP